MPLCFVRKVLVRHAFAAGVFYVHVFHKAGFSFLAKRVSFLSEQKQKIPGIFGRKITLLHSAGELPGIAHCIQIDTHKTMKPLQEGHTSSIIKMSHSLSITLHAKIPPSLTQVLASMENIKPIARLLDLFNESEIQAK